MNVRRLRRDPRGFVRGFAWSPEAFYLVPFTALGGGKTGAHGGFVQLVSRASLVKFALALPVVGAVLASIGHGVKLDGSELHIGYLPIKHPSHERIDRIPRADVDRAERGPVELFGRRTAPGIHLVLRDGHHIPLRLSAHLGEVRLRHWLDTLNEWADQQDDQPLAVSYESAVKRVVGAVSGSTRPANVAAAKRAHQMLLDDGDLAEILRLAESDDEGVASVVASHLATTRPDLARPILERLSSAADIVAARRARRALKKIS